MYLSIGVILWAMALRILIYVKTSFELGMLVSVSGLIPAWNWRMYWVKLKNFQWYPLNSVDWYNTKNMEHNLSQMAPTEAERKQVSAWEDVGIGCYSVH